MDARELSTSSDYLIDTSVLPLIEKINGDATTGRFQGFNPWLFFLLLLCATLFAAQRSHLSPSASPLTISSTGHKAETKPVFYSWGKQP